MPLAQEIKTFFFTGVLAAVAHYGVLVALVEVFAWQPVPATLVGYVAGGAVSYVLNRWLTFASVRAHSQAIWRFALVAGFGFGLTYGAMLILVTRWNLPYLPAQIATTGVVLVWSFVANKFWTFASAAAK